MTHKFLDHSPLLSAHFEREKISFRLWMLVGFSACILSILILRLFWVSLLSSSAAPTALPAVDNLSRSEIVDRHGTILATSVTTFSIYAHPTRITNKEEAAKMLHKIFPTLSEKKLLDNLSTEKPFVWIVRHVSNEKKMQVHALGIEGLGILKEKKRVYPHDNLFCHVVGLTNIDQVGITGIEKVFDARLAEEKKPLSLSLDTRLQHTVHQHVLECIQRFNAVGGNAVLVDIQTGEILAMVSLPDFSLTTPSETEVSFNRNTTGVYEFGSILKIFNVAMALNFKTATLDSIYDASRPLQLGRFKITDFKGQNRPLTVKEAFKYSSNIANAKIALDVGIERQMEFFKKMGFFSPVHLQLPGIAKPLLPKPWGKSTLITASYGYGLSLTPLHLIQGLQILLMGRQIPLTLLRTKEPAIPGQRVVSKEVSSKIAELLALAVQEGQAKKAASTCCAVGAKTGTANQLVRGRYQEKHNLTSCLSVFPIEAPRYALLVCIDQPKANASTYYYATAGWIAAPVVASIINNIAPLLHLINPSQPSLEQTIHSVVTHQDSPL